MVRKKVYILIIVLLLMAVFVYILFLSKPQVNVKSVTVESLVEYTQPEHIEYIKDENPVDSIAYFIERNRTYGDDGIQVFVQGDRLPSNDPNDYVMVTLELEINNRSIFDSHSSYFLVNGGEHLYDSYVVTKPNVEAYVFDGKFAKTECKFKFYMYIKDKSIKEIEEIIREMEFQIPFANEILKNSNQYFCIDDNDDVKFIFEGVNN